MGTRDRLLRCGERRDGQSWKMMNPNQCRNLIKPNSSLTEVCTTAECPRQPSSYWNVSPWSQVPVNLIIYYTVLQVSTSTFCVKQKSIKSMCAYTHCTDSYFSYNHNVFKTPSTQMLLSKFLKNETKVLCKHKYMQLTTFSSVLCFHLILIILHDYFAYNVRYQCLYSDIETLAGNNCHSPELYITLNVYISSECEFFSFQCSVTCHLGEQTRLVHCLDKVTQELSSDCNDTEKPDSIKLCLSKPCPKLGLYV